MTLRCIPALLSLALAAPAADFQAGIARVKITPDTPIWMSGYASRTHPSDGVVHDLWAKALALQDPKGNRVVIVTTDLIGLPRPVAEMVAARAQKEYGLPGHEALLLNSSHTHSGPVLRDSLIMWNLGDEDLRRIRDYTARLTDQLVTVIGAALGDLKPARLAYGEGSVGFAINRREKAAEGFRIGLNESGPRDLSVPVLRVANRDGSLRAVLFGYACHNTTLDIYQINGDYAGFAQIEFERAHPGATAMFMELCGADQNPNPRRKLELAEQHGKALADEVSRVLGGGMKPVHGPVRAAFRIVEPRFAPHTRETFERDLTDKNIAKVRRARAMLKAYEDGRPVRRIPYPVQAIRFDKGLTILALGGEVVVDYDLRVKREFNDAKEPIIVAGYSNDVMCYIPSLRVLKEGGYEADDSMIYYGQPGPFNDDIEEIVFGGIRSVMHRVGR